MTSAIQAEPNQWLARQLWTATALLLGFLVFIHLGVMLCFLTTTRALPWVVPIAFVVAALVAYGLGRRQKLRKPALLWAIGVALIIIVLAVLISAVFFDLSWDGQWYHQAAVYRMSQDWNPLTEPLGDFPEHNVQWVRHYAKGPWFGAVAMKALTGSHEAGKFATWVALAATLMSMTATALDLGITRGRTVALGIITALNPVVLSEIVSYLVDGLMICYLACYTAALLSLIKRGHNPLGLWVGTAATICSINSKFTGLIFLCFIAAGTGCYCLIKSRSQLIPLIGWHLVALGLGVAVWGYNPYITNTLHRSQPFYPLLGSRDYPSMSAQGHDVLELYETPPNMMGRPRLLRQAYAIFGRPSFAPYNNQREAEFMWPFAARPSDLDVYRFHDTRIAGLGPWFSGVLVLSLLLSVWLLITAPSSRLILFIGTLVIVTSLLLSKHLWWARYGPQLWWLPLLPLGVAFKAATCRYQTKLTWALLVLLLLNTLMVASVRLHWEVKSTQRLHQQLVELKEAEQPIEISMGYFNVTVSQRLRDWGIEFEEVQWLRPEDSTELMSVARGNPGAVRYRLKD